MSREAADIIDGIHYAHQKYGSGTRANFVDAGGTADKAANGFQVLARFLNEMDSFPRHRVIETELGYEIDGWASWFTADRVLAREVARELDRIARRTPREWFPRPVCHQARRDGSVACGAHYPEMLSAAEPAGSNITCPKCLEVTA